ncbi:flagellar hook-associated protein FlgK [Rhodothalassium salexigens]|uniref:flagellar hook-associated protein FlgK n=1 Tax=Rhodothalassium salexigens TaxID=1086 RepID=UPI001911C6E9|nr:flagellar hook-associated protein FlgK [Rhodothalassium salexigens]MBK5910733.1 flagellar hook-associated protein FlgK [Rhodothalassium salexigens]MBK5919817.1 flagellar hook-associated protein FlgK [Rhodothalassium salexigens]
MALLGALQNSLSGITANQEALRITSNNIANVNNPTFARSEVQQSTRVLGGQGAGVFTETAERVIDRFLERAVLESESDLESASVQRQILDQFQSLLGDPDSDSTATARLDKVFGALSTLAQNPTDSFARRDVVDKLNGFLGEVTRVAEDIQGLRQTIQDRLGDRVDEANRLLRELSDLNPRLVAQNAQGASATGLQNRAAELTSQLSQLIDIKVETNANNSLSIRTASGAQLVGDTYAQLSIDRTGSVSSGTLFPRIQIERFDNQTNASLGAPQDFQANIRSGEIAGLIDLRDDILPQVSRELGEFASQVRTEFNRVHNEFTAVPPPATLSGRPTGLAAGNDANFTGQVTLAVVDRATNRMVDEVLVDFDAGTATSLSSGAPQNFGGTTLGDAISAINSAFGTGPSGASVSLTNGTLSIDSGTPNQGLSISQDPTNPSQRAGQGFSAFFGLNDLVTSDASGNFENGVSATDSLNDTTPGGGDITLRLVDGNGRVVTTATINTNTAGGTYGDVFTSGATGFNQGGLLGAFGSFSITGTGQVVFNPGPGFDDLEVQVVNDTTNMAGSGLTVTQFGGIGDAALEEAALGLEVSPRVANDLSAMATAEYTRGQAVGDLVLGGGDQRGARALEEIATTQIGFDAAGGQPIRTTTLGNYMSNVLAGAGALAAQAQNREIDAQALLTELSQRRGDVSGVNMEEELANLVVFQNSFNASARVLQSVQDAFDQLLAVV